MSFRLGLSVVPLAAMLGGCGGVADLDCARIAEKAKALSQSHPMKISRLANVRETSRSGTEARCAAEARWSDNVETTVYVRAYEEGENVMVAYQVTPFE